MRRLTETQYRNIIADVFGTTISVGGVFDPLTRTAGLLAAGTTIAEDTPESFANDVKKARFIAAQVVDKTNRDILIGCKPAHETAPDDNCARQFYGSVGRLLYRRPMSTEELRASVALAHTTAQSLNDFYAGLAAGLSGMLQALDFRYVIDVVEPRSKSRGRPQLDAYSKASRLSFFLWNTAPDDALLTAAGKGELDTKEGLQRQTDRLLASPRLQAGVRGFFSDMFGFDDFQTLSKDATIYPAFSQTVAVSAQEQTLRTIIDQLILNGGDYRDIFTTRKTFLNAALGVIYHVPIDPAEGEWMPYEFPVSENRAGILTQVTFLALRAHPGQSSPTLRGRALREMLLCQRVPDPPANVNFDLFNDPNSPNKTARDRLKAHSANPVCAGCHKLTDPMGLTLENFDGIGQFRDNEKGAPIDASGEFNGTKFTNAAGLAQAVRDDPAAPTCLVQKLYTYAVGRAPNDSDKPVIAGLGKFFQDQHYRLPALFRSIVSSDSFFAVSPAQDAPSPNKSADARPTFAKGDKS